MHPFLTLNYLFKLTCTTQVIVLNVGDITVALFKIENNQNIRVEIFGQFLYKTEPNSRDLVRRQEKKNQS